MFLMGLGSDIPPLLTPPPGDLSGRGRVEVSSLEARPGGLGEASGTTADAPTGSRPAVSPAPESEDAAPLASSAGIVALILADLMPAVGVLFLGWQVFPIILLYWLENVVVGVVTVLKMAYAQGVEPASETLDMDDLAAVLREHPDRSVVVLPRDKRFSLLGGPGGRAVAIAFFCVHFGLFTLIEGIFVVVIFGPAASWSREGGGGGVTAGFLLWMALAFLGLCVSHATSFRRNFIGSGEYRHLTPQAIMAQPYGRLVVMQITVIIGGILLDEFGTPLAALLLLVGLKTCLDVIAHRREHRKAVPPVQSIPASANGQ